MKIIKSLISVILSIVVIFALYSLFILSNVSSFFTTKNIEKAVSDIDVIHEINKIQNSSLTAGGKTDISDMVDRAYEEAENHGISKNLVDEIFNSKEVKGFLGNAVGRTTDYIVNGKDSKPVTSEEFNELLDDNMDTWIDKSGVDISDSKKEVLVVRVKEASKGIIDNIPNTSTISQKVDTEILDAIKLIFSSKVRMALVIISLVSLLIIFFLKRKENKWLLYTAVSGLIAGIMTIATSFVLTDIVSLVLNEYNLSFLVNSFSDIFSHKVFITGIVSAVICIIIFIVYFILNKRQLKTPN